MEVSTLNKREDVLKLILSNMDLTALNNYNLIMNNTSCDSKRGYLFESICELLIITKCMEGINYNEIKSGEYPSINSIKNIREVLRKNISSKEGGVSDILIKINEHIVPFSIKYKNTFLPSSSDISHIDNTFKKEKYKIGLIVKDKKLVLNHKYTNKQSIHKILHDKVITDNLLFDEEDVIKGIKVFTDKFKKYENNVKGFYEVINKDYLNSPRKQLVLKLHQKLAFLKFVNNIKNNEYKHIIAHKPRSGKSILMLLMSSYLLENNHKRILIMTSVPDTINDFVSALNTYIDFKDIKYKIQKEDDFNCIEEDFTGIVFSSLQFFKKDIKIKTNLLKKLNFDVIFNDECHIGGSTLKTQKNILEINQDDILLDNINKNFKLNIFASGTSDKTKKYYKIKPSCIYEWEIEDEAYMKEIIEDKDIENIMACRHGPYFKECLDDISLNRDYSKCPIQVLMKSLIPQDIINKIIEYNTKNNANYGFSFSSLFALKQVNNKHKYEEQFEICSSSDGIEMLINILDNIISNDKNKLTIIKQVEKIQNKYKSRISTKENPLLTIMYMPTNTGNNTIDGLQKTLKKFVEKNKLWTDYNIEYSNSTDDTGDVKQKYNDFIKSIMKKTKEDNKKGCILLLGNKGGTGITYHDCDVSISLDDGHSIDNQKQKYSRVLTEAPGKTIGINIDMNIQRTYLFLLDKINNFRKITKKEMTNDEIIYYLYTHKIFLFDPLHYDNNNFKDSEIKSYYKNEIENIMKEIDDTLLLQNIICNDDLKDIIKTDWKNLTSKKNNPSLEGDQKDCPKPSTTPIEIDPPEKEEKEEEKDIENEVEVEEELINQTFEMCKSFMFPLLSILSREYNIINFNHIFDDDICKDIILKICQEKEIDLNNINYNKIKNIMEQIIEMNDDIVNSIREIYRIATPSNLRSLIEKHFIPSKDEKKKNAEIPTPVILVDDMLSKIPSEYWTDIHSTFEPCCGKGNFVLGIFDMFFKGLEKKIPDKVERCKVIMTKCIYFADLTNLNVFITTEILKCHIEDKCGVKVDYEFNSNICDTLIIDIEDIWGLEGFDAVIGNPPYNANGDTNTGNTIWQFFTKKALNECLKENGYLLFVHPPGWRKPSNKKAKFYGLYELMTQENQMIYLEIHNSKEGDKIFKCGTRYDWYLIEKKEKYKNTTIIDLDKKENNIDTSLWSWLPNNNFKIFDKIISNDKKNNLQILCDSSYSRLNKKITSKVKNTKFKHELIYLTPKAGVRYMYSNCNNKGHFGIKKIIIGDSGIESAVFDNTGNYGMTQDSFGILFDSDIEGENLLNVIKSNNFISFIKESCIWSSFRVDWRLFTYFKKDFWKEFINKDEGILEPKKKKLKIKDEKKTNYSVKELKNLLKEKGIKGYSGLKKQELIDLLEK